MGRTQELSDFERGTVIGCHLSNKSVRQISALLELPRSTVSSVIVKWKHLGATTVQPRSGRPHKLSEKECEVLKSIVCKNRMCSIAALAAEFQTASGSDVSLRTVRRELHEMGFRGKAASHNPNITTRNAKRRLEWCIAHRHWTPEQWKRVLWSGESGFILWQSDGQIRVGRTPGERYSPDCVLPTVHFGGGGVMDPLKEVPQKHSERRGTPDPPRQRSSHATKGR
ncbi:hypothetical protein GJAV_G00169650 [Gymnothorax javanicus]|nr:hypothetical protein GJAV_G00169650 [Gymnothorax javanicus]